MTDDGGAKTPGVTCRNTADEKHPCVCAIPGPRNFQRKWHTQFMAGLHESTGIITAVGFVKIDCQKVAGVILQQRINADRVLAGQMAVNHSIGQWDQ